MKKYDFDFKISVVEAYKNGLNYKEIREKFHVTKTCFYDWLKLYKTKVHQKEKTFTYKQYEELQKRFEKISRELEIICSRYRRLYQARLFPPFRLSAS